LCVIFFSIFARVSETKATTV